MGRHLLSRKVQAIEYVHADDGLPYRHDFSKSGSTIELTDAGAIVIKNKRRKLWDTFHVNGTDQPFLINPQGVRTMATKAGKAWAKKMAAARRRKANPPKKRRHHKRRRSASVSVASAPARRHHKRRRNPPSVNLKSILAGLQQGAEDAGFVVAGKAAVRLLSSRFSYEDGSMMDSLVETAGAMLLGLVAPRIVGRDRARFLLAGALASPLETLIAQSNVPYISPLLGAAPQGVNTRAIYPAADAGFPLGRRVAAYAPANADGSRAMLAAPSYSMASLS